MRLIKNTLLLFFFLATTEVVAIQTPSFNEPEFDIVVNNRVLATINKKPITVLDLAKKMDLFFNSQYPEYANSPQAKYQFYMARWKSELNELIERELILADAQEHKLDITRGDIRQEIEQMFGPNVITGLDRAGLTMDEAWDMVKDDITIRRVISAKVNSKAMRHAKPENLKRAYREYIKENSKPETYTYRVISIRSPDVAKGAEIAEISSNILMGGEVAITDLPTILAKDSHFDPQVAINVSEEFVHTKEKIAQNFLEPLETISAGEYSPPVAQKGRKDNKTVHRIFYLADVDKGGIPSLSEVTDLLRRQIMNKAVEEETVTYLDDLHKHFSISNQDALKLLPEDYQPFLLQRVQ